MKRQPHPTSLCQPLLFSNQTILVPAVATHKQTRAVVLRLLAGLAIALLGLAAPGLGQTTQAAEKSGAPKESSVSRGEYIVNNVAVCSQCHTPRDGQGRPERAHWLEGASVWLQSAESTANWPQQAPRIAGALPGTDDEMLTLLTTGMWRTGTYLRPPMPQFRMSRQDAEAVIAYLKSVKPSPK
jgi:mono/diheme cytochrome c family protein